MSESESPTGADDWRSISHLAKVVVERLIEPVEGMHRAIAEPWLRVGGQPARRAYEGTTTNVYRAIRGTTALVTLAVGVGANLAARHNRLPRVNDSARAGNIYAVGHAIWGDSVGRMHAGMSLRDTAGRIIEVEPDAVAAAFSAAASRLVVLIHGLGATEQSWATRPDAASPGLAELLDEEGLTPVLVRYDTGRTIEANAYALIELLGKVHAAWPTEIEQISLVGYSMGGLIADQIIQLADGDEAWLFATDHVVTVGAPHLGSHIEHGAELLARVLRIAPQTRPLSGFIDGRSAGIKDLGGQAPRRESPKRRHVERHFLGGSITNDPGHPFGSMVGDLVVRSGSSTGSGRSGGVPATNVAVVGGVNHSSLIHNAEIHGHILGWLCNA